VHDFRFNFQLLVRFQRACALSFLPHALNSIHNVTLLRKESIAEVSGPLNVVS